MHKYLKIIWIALLLVSLNGCVLTKLLTVPMRVGGAIVSIVPGPGDLAHEAIDKTAEQIDKAPL